MRFLFFAIVTAASITFPLIAHACSCESSGPPCQSFWAAPVVFSGRVVNVRPFAREVGKPGSGSFTRHVEVRFSVSAEYRGVVGPTLELVSGGGSCDYEFEQGREYLVYAYKENGLLTTSICTPTKPLEKALEDLQFIGSLGSAKPVGSVSGRVSQYRSRQSAEAWQAEAPMANLSIALTGKTGRAVNTTTNEAGEFRFADLSPGEYQLGFSAPEGFTPATSTEKLVIPEKGCVVKDFVLARETSLNGRITDADGKPVTKILAELVPIEQINERYKRDAQVAVVDENGRFALRLVPPGSYYLGVRLRSSGLKHGYPRTFYPGTQIIESAVVIIIREGQILKDLDFHLPKTFPVRTVDGVVTYPDGKPVANAGVSVEEVGLGDIEGTRSDAAGRFTLTLFEGPAYKIRAHVSLESGGQRHAHPIEIGPRGPATNLKIVITEPNGNCPRCRP